MDTAQLVTCMKTCTASKRLLERAWLLPSRGSVFTVTSLRYPPVTGSSRVPSPRFYRIGPGGYLACVSSPFEHDSSETAPYLALLDTSVVLHPHPLKKTRLAMACITCRARKIKCDRTLPTCLNCRLRSSHCTYAGERRKRRWAKPGPDQGRPPILSHYHPPGNDRHSRSLEPSENRDARVSELVGRIDTQLDQNGDNTPEAGSTNSTSSAVFEPEESVGTQPSLPSSNMDCQPSVRIGGDAHEDYVETEDLLLDTILDKSVLQLPSVARLSLWMRTMNGDEYTGPSSGISTISDLGLKWIRQNVPDSETLCNSILEIRTSILAHLRQPKCVPLTLSSTPGSSPALKPIRLSDMAEYVDAYFTTTQTLLPILDRSQFEDQMRKYSTHTSGTMYSWNALLNAVLASGCRAALSDETAEAFQTSGREAWGYFQNAIYYESKMMNAPTDLLAVQAVAVMTIFAQGMSSPQRLEFTMSSAAARLAQSLGLNHRPPPEWEHSQQEQNERNRVFWVVYCLDKSIALRCGRPPVLNDHEISCAFPHGAESVLGGLGLAGKGHKVDVLLCVVKLARICGMVADKLYSASGLSLPASALQQAATKILNSLECWRTSLPTGIRPSKPIAKIRDLGHSSKLQLLVLHSTYYYVLCAIYRRFTPMFAQDGKDYRHLVSQATTVSHIEAARSIILLTKFFDIESFTPGW